MKKRPTIPAEDVALFRDAISGARPLREQSRRQPEQPVPSSKPIQREKDDQDVMAQLLDHPLDSNLLETDDQHEHRQNGVQRVVMRKLKRGQYARQSELDLHGMTVAQARDQLAAFIQESRSKGYRCVRIIHGKGLRSSQRGPVLKPRVAHWLRQRQEVLAYCPAQATDGGSGAVYVLLRR